MNLVETIMKSLGSDAVAKLANVLGAGEAETKKAVGAAVPAMLSGTRFAGLEPQGRRETLVRHSEC